MFPNPYPGNCTCAIMAGLVPPPPPIQSRESEKEDLEIDKVSATEKNVKRSNKK